MRVPFSTGNRSKNFPNMCIVFMCISQYPEQDGYKVIIASNRDEFFNRPTKQLDWWDNVSGILSGIDLFHGKEGGTWLGISKTGKIGILTNYRQSPKFKKKDEKGRGHLVSDFLKSKVKPREFVEKVKEHGNEYGGFNLIVGNVFPGKSEIDFSYYCNKEHEPLENMKPGVYCLANRYLDYGWKKVELGKERFEKIVKGKSSMQEKMENMLELLQDGTRYGVDDVFRNPEDEGIPEAYLEGLTAISVYMPEVSYGTRTNSVIVIDDEDNVTYVERTMQEPIDARNAEWKTNTFHFKIESC